MILNKDRLYTISTFLKYNGRQFSYVEIKSLCRLALITLVTTHALILVFMMTRTLDLNFVDIVRIIANLSCQAYKSHDHDHQWTYYVMA